jgi:hypothetical protein
MWLLFSFVACTISISKRRKKIMTIMKLLDAAKKLDLANNGYTLEANMDAEFVRQAHRLVSRGTIVYDKIKDCFGTVSPAFFTKKSAAIYL